MPRPPWATSEMCPSLCSYFAAFVSRFVTTRVRRVASPRTRSASSGTTTWSVWLWHQTSSGSLDLRMRISCATLRTDANGLRSSGPSGKTSSKAPPTKVLRSFFVGCRFASVEARIVQSRPVGCEHQEQPRRRIESRLEIESCVGAGKGGYHSGSVRERVDPIMG